MDHFDIILANLNFLRSQKILAQNSQNFARRRRQKFLWTISAIKIGNIYIGIAFPQAQRAGFHSAAGELFLRFLTFLKKKLMFLMQGESSHTCTTEPFAARVGPRAMRMLIRAHENAARGHIAFSHFGDAAAILSARGLVHKRWHASISQGSCICTSHTCTSALPCAVYDI